ncbi:MAG: metallophosphoesterase family protein [Candidatus Heimdallarchaeota archaeon]|nr:MAG: metallophosphoesterase family protein [Candidatus Heimdallarchaeota archaeon]
MKIGIISDIHSNYYALKTVIAFLEGQHIDVLICAGDFVGYGPQPKECVNFFLYYPISHYFCLGNHDIGVRFRYSDYYHQEPIKQDHKILKTFNFRESAAEMLDRNAQDIQEDHFQFLFNLPFKQIFQLDHKKFYLTHGTPSLRRRENVGKYLLPPPLQDPRVTIDRLKNDKKAVSADIIIIGHTHRRFLIARDNFYSWSLIEDILDKKPTKFPLKFPFNKNRIILNPGSIGQPRDGTGNASFVVIDLDDEILEFCDLEYQMKNFYRLAKEKCAPGLQDSSFWANKFGYFSKE